MWFLSFCHLPYRAQGCDQVRTVITCHFNLWMPKAYASCKITWLELFAFANKLGYLAIEVGWENICRWYLQLSWCLTLVRLLYLRYLWACVLCNTLASICVSSILSSLLLSWSVEDISAWQSSSTSYVSVFGLGWSGGCHHAPVSYWCVQRIIVQGKC